MNLVEFQMLSNTSKNSGNFLKLPNKIFFDEKSCENFLTPNEEAVDYFLSHYYKSTLLLVDCEFKNGFSITQYLLEKKKDINFIEIKPNDLTVTSLGIMLDHYTNLMNINVLIYGTGNLSYKIAQLLKEKNANVFIDGRNIDKIEKMIDSLNTFSLGIYSVKRFKRDIKLDILISAVSKKGIIDESYLEHLKKDSICVDVGIGNFSPTFIRKANTLNFTLRRLDVSLSQQILDAQIDTQISKLVSNKIGSTVINSLKVVSGGIIGKEGEIIVDNFKEIKSVIGIANGIGGVKNESDLSTEEHIKIQEVQSYIEQNC